MQGQSIHLPFKVNPAGVIPPIFASSLLLMPLTVAGFAQSSGSGWLLWIANNVFAWSSIVYVALCVNDCFLCLLLYESCGESEGNSRQLKNNKAGLSLEFVRDSKPLPISALS